MPLPELLFLVEPATLPERGGRIRLKPIHVAVVYFEHLAAREHHASPRRPQRHHRLIAQFLFVVAHQSHEQFTALCGEVTVAFAVIAVNPLEKVGERESLAFDPHPQLRLVVGGEHTGVPEGVLAQCDAVVRIPMAGFIRSYNLQAAVAMIAAERMRQEQA